jgi:hypothetical protein
MSTEFGGRPVGGIAGRLQAMASDGSEHRLHVVGEYARVVLDECMCSRGGDDGERTTR